MIDAIEKAISYVDMYMLNAHEINIPKNGGARIEHPEYSLRAVRESLVNAVIHRDWFVNGGNIMVEMYRGRVIIKSPGELPKGVTLKNMSSICQRRNHLLADLLIKAGYGEKAGTGIGKMINYCRELDSPDPVFESDGWVNVTFYPSPRSDVAYSKQKETCGHSS